MSKKKEWKLLCTMIASCLALILILLPSDTIHATETEGQSIASKLQVETEVGYSGMYRSGMSVPVKVKLTNLIARDLKGDLVLNIIDSNGTSVAHIMPLEITSGSTVEAMLTANGNFSKIGTWVQFYEGGVDKGKLVEVSGTRYVEGRSISSNQVVGIAASDPDTLNFVAFFNNQGINVTPIVLGEDFFAASHHDLSMFTIIALNDVATSQWSEQKVKAIKDWVADGGTLIVGGGAGFSQTSAAFNELLPVEGQSTAIWSNTELLMNYAESSEKLEPLSIIQGRLLRGNIILEDNGVPIVAANQYGGGSVIYTAFDLGLKPFANWDGRSALLRNILGGHLMNTNYSNPQDYWWGLDSSASYFPRLKSPQVGGLLIIFVIYILIVAPIMYLVLRRFDRREWSWWIIPSLAVLSTFIIVFIGTRDKSDQYVHAVKVAQIEGEFVRETSINKVFIPNSKDITLTLPDQSHVNFGTQSFNSGSEVSTNKQYRINYNGDGRSVTFTNNKYWTTKTVMMNDEIYDASQYGRIQARIEQQDSGPALMISNHTGASVEHLSLIVNNQLYYIGSVDDGEEIVYSLPAALSVQAGSTKVINNYYAGRYYNGNYSGSLVSGSRASWNELQRETSLLDYNVFIQYGAALVAFSYDDTDKYIINNKKVKTDEMKMWVVDITETIMNELQMQQTIVPTTIELDGDGSYSLMNDQYFTLNEGALLFKYHIPGNTNEGNAPIMGQILTDVNAAHYNGKFSLFNEQTEQWEVISDVSMELTPYVSDFNMLQLKLESAQNFYEGSVPLLLLDREVQ